MESAAAAVESCAGAPMGFRKADTKTFVSRGELAREQRPRVVSLRFAHGYLL